MPSFLVALYLFLSNHKYFATIETCLKFLNFGLQQMKIIYKIYGMTSNLLFVTL